MCSVSRVGFWGLVASAAILASASSALAGALPMTAAIVVVDAERNGETGQFSAIFPANTVIEGQYNWALDEPVQILSTQSGTVLGDLTDLGLTFNADPAVSLRFAVQAGPYGTNFTITSAVVTFDPISNPQAYATAAVTVTDENSDTATLTGKFAGNKAYEARYNGTGVVPGTTWATLVSTPVVTAVSRSATASERRPAAGWEAINTTINSISSEFKFHLTPLDSASGTSKFEVVAIPEPASLCLLALGGVAALRRRRA